MKWRQASTATSVTWEPLLWTQALGLQCSQPGSPLQLHGEQGIISWFRVSKFAFRLGWGQRRPLTLMVTWNPFLLERTWVTQWFIQRCVFFFLFLFFNKFRQKRKWTYRQSKVRRGKRGNWSKETDIPVTVNRHRGLVPPGLEFPGSQGESNTELKCSYLSQE